MDQLRTILAWLKAQHFWVLSVLVALIGILCWWKAAGTLRAQYDTNQKQITGQFQSLQTVRNDPFHPNDVVNAKQIAETTKLAEDVAKLWQQLYDRQRAKALEWPDALKQSFRDHVEKLEFRAEIPRDLREHYQNYIFQHFPNLPKRIGARAMREEERGAAGGGAISRAGRSALGPEGGGIGFPADGQLVEDEDDYICEWSAQDQAAVREDLEFEREEPSSLLIWVTQENLWVYETLLEVIKNTNEAAGASRKSNAAVRTIHTLAVGQRAAPFSRTPGRIYKVPMAAATSEDGTTSEVPTEPSPDGQPSEMPSMPGRMDFGAGRSDGAPMSAAEEEAMLLSGRYLDEAGKPIGGGAPAGGESLDGGAAPAPIDPASFGREYKRLPVRMVLEMDQRHLPRLIAECSNQPLQVEVQEVRINPEDGGGGDGGGFSGSRGAFGDRGGEDPFSDSGSQLLPSQPNIVTVVIQGVIYIFNKPNPADLKATDEETSLVERVSS